MVIVELVGAALLLAVLGVLVLVLRAVTNPAHQPSPQPTDVTRQAAGSPDPAAAGADPKRGPDPGEARDRSPDAAPGARSGLDTDTSAGDGPARPGDAGDAPPRAHPDAGDAPSRPGDAGDAPQMRPLQTAAGTGSRPSTGRGTDAGLGI